MDAEKAAAAETVPAVTTTTQTTTETAGNASSPQSSASAPAPAAAPKSEEPAAPKPPKTTSPVSGPMGILIEAFPGIEPAVIKAVLTASRGELEPAFNALLGMSDPDAVIEETPPPPPPRNPELPPRRSSRPAQQGDYYESGQRGGYNTTTPRDQLEADELYARQLAENLGAIPRPHPNERVGGSRSQYRQGPGNGPNQQGRQRDDDYDDREHSFLDDDFPVIKENLRKGFLETQAKVNKWVLDFKKKIDGDDTPDSPPPPPARSQTFGSVGAHNNFGRDLPSSQRHQNSQYQTVQTRPRYSTDGYDPDPSLLTDDFRHLEIRDNTLSDPAAPSRPARPAANPNLLSSERSPKPSGRKVSFQDPEDEDDLYAPPSSKPPARQASPGTTTATTSKWQPLKSVEPTPLDRDPFSLGDSDDEKEHEVPEKDVKPGVAGAQESGVKGEVKEEKKEETK